MIGQSGLPMNSLAAARDTGQEGILNPASETVEGEFEKAFARGGALIADEAALTGTPVIASDTSDKGAERQVSLESSLPDQTDATRLLSDTGDPAGQIAPLNAERQKPALTRLESGDQLTSEFPVSAEGQPPGVSASQDQPSTAGATQSVAKMTDAPPASAGTDPMSQPVDLARMGDAEASTHAVAMAIDLPLSGDRIPQLAADRGPQAPLMQALAERYGTGTDLLVSQGPQPLGGVDPDPASTTIATPESALSGAGRIVSDDAGGRVGAGAAEAEHHLGAPGQALKPMQVLGETEPVVKPVLLHPLELTSAPLKAASDGALGTIAGSGDGRAEVLLTFAQPSQLQTGEAVSRLRNSAATQAQSAFMTTGVSQSVKLLAEDQFDLKLSAPAVSAPALLSRTDPASVVQSSPSVEPRAVVQQVTQAVVRMDGARTEITLDPVELGRVSLTFVTREEGVSITVTADRPETADLLRRNSEQLQRDLLNAGYDNVDLGFSQGDGGSDNHQAEQPAKGAGTAQAAGVTYGARWSEAGLDIRI